MTEIPIRYTVSGENRIIQATENFERAHKGMFNSMQRGGADAGRTFHQMRGEITIANNELSRMARRTESAFRFVVAGVVARGARDLVSYADAYKSLDGQIATVTQSEEEAVRVRAKLFELSEDTRTSIETTGTVYGRVSRAVEDLRISEEKRLKVVEVANKAAKISQSTTQEQTSALIQFSQGLAKGVLDGEELKSVMENTPVLAKAIAEGLGVTIGALKDMGATGRLNAEAVVDALVRMEGEIDTSFQGVPRRVSEGFEVLETAVIRYVGELDEARGLSDAAGRALESMAQNIDVVGASLTALAVIGGGAIFGRMAGSAGAATKQIVTQAIANRTLAKEVLARSILEKEAAAERLRVALLSYQIEGKGVEALTRARMAATKATQTHTLALKQHAAATNVAATVGRGLLGVLGGIPGVLSMAALAVFAYSDSLTSSTDATHTHTDALDSYLKKIRSTDQALSDLTGKQLAFALTKAESDQVGAGNQLSAAGRAVIDALEPFRSDVTGALIGAGLADMSEVEARYAGILKELSSLTAQLEAGRIPAEDFNAELLELEQSAPELRGAAVTIAAALEEYAAAADLAAEKTATLQELQKNKSSDGAVGPFGIDQSVISAAEAAISGPGEAGPNIDVLLKDLEAYFQITSELELQNKLLSLRLEGREDEADALRELTELETKAGDGIEINRVHVEALLAERRKLNAQLEKQAAVQKQVDRRDSAIAQAREEVEILEERLQGNEELAALLELQFELRRQFPDLADQELRSLLEVKQEEREIGRLIKERREDEINHQRELSRTRDIIFNTLASNDFGGSISDILRNSVYDGFAAGLAPFLNGINIQASISGFISSALQPAFSDAAASFGLSSLAGAAGLGGMLSGGLSSGIGLINGLGSSLGFANGAATSLSLATPFGGSVAVPGAGTAGFFGSGATLAGTLGAAGLGFGAGSLLGGALGLNSTGSGIGGGLGGGLGFALGGPVGGILGGLGGSLIGGLFGGGSKDKAGTTVRVGSDGVANLVNQRTTGKGDSAASDQLGAQLVNSLNTIAQQLGGSLRAGSLLGELGFREDEFFFDPSANATSKGLGRPSKDADTLRFQTGEAAVEAALINALRSGALTGLPVEVQNRLKTVTSTTLEQVLSDVQVFLGLSETIETGLADIQDPLRAGLEAITNEYRQAAEQYEAFGADVGRVNEFYLQQQKTFIEQYRSAGTQLLSDFLTELQTGEFGGLTPQQRLTEARGIFEDLAISVNAGADVDDQALVQAANSFLEASLAVNAFTSDFFNDRARVEDIVSTEIDNFNAAVADVLSTAELIQPLDTLADIGNTTNDLLSDVNSGISDVADQIAELAARLQAAGFGGLPGGGRTLEGLRF